MRFFIVIIIWVAIVGGLWGYIVQRDRGGAISIVASPVDIVVERTFTVEITTTFSTEKDPFALNTDNKEMVPLEIKINGTPLKLPHGEILRGRVMRLENVSGLLAGHNEIFVKATPPITESTLEQGVRIKILENQGVVLDETIWSSQGALVSGSATFTHQQGGEQKYEH